MWWWPQRLLHHHKLVQMLRRWRRDDSLETTCSAPVCAVCSSVCSCVCLHPQPSASPLHLTPHLSPFRQFSHERLNNADSRLHLQLSASSTDGGWFYISSLNQIWITPPHRGRHRGRIGKCAVWRRTRISYFLYFLLSLRYCPHTELVKLRGSSRGWGQWPSACRHEDCETPRHGACIEYQYWFRIQAEVWRIFACPRPSPPGINQQGCNCASLAFRADMKPMMFVNVLQCLATVLQTFMIC